MENKDKKPQMHKTVNNLLFSARNPDDREVLAQVNELATSTPGIKPKAALKNFLLRCLPGEIKRLRESGGSILGRAS
ncbi:MAG: hypothetical protein ACYSUX_19145 [Planctomycetota bacterium]|jgi:hypothetical protein